MPAGKYDLYIEQGTTWSLPLLWKAMDDTPQDLTGFTARMHIRKKITDAAYEVELTTENGGIILGGVDGTINLFMSATSTTAIDIKDGVYDLELVSGGGIVKRLLEGKATISPEVTRE